ncbi:MAG: hypothetical protein ACLGGX_01260 [Bdellovibrionia bacterium]
MENDKIDPQEKCWLVRSSLKIVGPFNLQEVTQLLAARHISILDEIRRPHTRWSYIRENSIFNELVLALREEQEKTVEKTFASTTNTNITHKLGMTKTDWVQSEDLTPTPVDIQHTEEIKEAKPISQHFRESQTSVDTQPARSYGVESDLSWQNRRSSFRKRLQYAFLAVVLVLISGITIRHFIKSREKEESLNRIERLAHLHFTQGLAGKAFSSFQKIKDFRPLNEEYEYDYGVLLVNNGDFIEGRRILEKILNSGNLSRERNIEILNVLGVSYIEDKNWDKAQNLFMRSLGLDSTNLYARMNMMQIKMLKGLSREVFDEANFLSRKFPQDLELKLIKNLAALELIKANALKFEWSEFESERRLLIGKRHYLSQHLNIVYLSILDQLGGMPEEIEKLAWVFLNTVPFQRKNFTTNYQLAGRFTRWEFYLPFCKQLQDKYNQSHLLKLTLAYCFLESDKEKEALKLIEQVLSEVPTHSTANIFKALYLTRVGKSNEAMTALDSINTSGVLIAQYVRLVACSDLAVKNCTGEFAERLVKLRAADSFGLYHYSEYLTGNGQRKSAWDHVTKGINIDPNYMPLIELRGRLEGALD